MLRLVKTNTAGGKANAHRIRLTYHTLDATNELIPWHVVRNISRRIFRGALETNCFVSAALVRCTYSGPQGLLLQKPTHLGG